MPITTNKSAATLQELLKTVVTAAEAPLPETVCLLKLRQARIACEPSSNGSTLTRVHVYSLLVPKMQLHTASFMCCSVQTLQLCVCMANDTRDNSHDNTHLQLSSTR